MPKRLIEAGKTLLIIFLLISAVFLAGNTGLFNNFLNTSPLYSSISSLFGSKSNKASYAESNAVISKAAIPVYAAVTSKYGDHCGIKYDSNALNVFYNRISNVLGTAFYSASTPEETNEDDFRLALSSVGFFIDFGEPLPVSSLVKSRDLKLTASNSTESVRRLCVAGVQNRVYLYFINEDDKTFYRSVTTVLYSDLTAVLSEYLPNDAKFAYELNSVYSNTDQYSLLLKSSKIMSVIASNPLYTVISKDKILEQFGINSMLGSQYSESSNSVLFVGEQFTLRINGQGTAVYKETGGTAGLLKIKSTGNTPSSFDILESAKNLVSSTIGTSCGSRTVLSLTGLNYDTASKSWVITFDYFVNGILVKLSDNQHAAVINVRGDHITNVNLVFRSYSLTERAVDILPERQAAVLVSLNKEPKLSYLDDGTGFLTASWTET